MSDGEISRRQAAKEPDIGVEFSGYQGSWLQSDHLEIRLQITMRYDDESHQWNEARDIHAAVIP